MKEREKIERKKREREKKRERDFKYLLTLILTVLVSNTEWKSVGLELTIPMMYHT